MGRTVYNIIPTIFPSIVSAMVDWVYPPECPLTHDRVNTQGQLSAAGWARLRFISDPFCFQCGVPFDVAFAPPGTSMRCVHCLDDPPAFDQARAGFVYDTASRDLILPFKHGDRLHLQDVLTLLLRQGLDRLDPVPWDMIVPVPLHPWRAIRRRYNQSTLLARQLARSGLAPLNTRVLRRVRATPPQGNLGRHERIRNVAGAFDVPHAQRPFVQGKTILLIDDVMTTGATLDDCAKTLKKNGAHYVACLTLARAVSDPTLGKQGSPSPKPDADE